MKFLVNNLALNPTSEPPKQTNKTPLSVSHPRNLPSVSEQTGSTLFVPPQAPRPLLGIPVLPRAVGRYQPVEETDLATQGSVSGGLLCNELFILF